MNYGEIWECVQGRPAEEDDERTPYRLIVQSPHLITPNTKKILAVPIVSRDPDSLLAVRLTEADPMQGWICCDDVMPHYRPWLKGPIGACSPETIAKVVIRLKAALNLFD